MARPGAARTFAAALSGASQCGASFVATPRAGRRASIALVLRVNPETGDEEALFIKRTVRSGDPWSGNVALPGGRREVGDRDDCATAARECLEEVGVDVGDGARWEALGRIADDRVVLNGRRPLVLSTFGFLRRDDAKAPIEVTPQPSEVAHAWWVPTTALEGENVAWRSLALVDAFAPLRARPRVAKVLEALGLTEVTFACVRLPRPPGAAADADAFADADADADAFALWGLTLSCLSDARRRAGLRPLVGPGAAPDFARGFRGPNALSTTVLQVAFAALRLASRREAPAALAAAAAALLLGAGAALLGRAPKS